MGLYCSDKKMNKIIIELDYINSVARGQLFAYTMGLLISGHKLTELSQPGTCSFDGRRREQETELY